MMWSIKKIMIILFCLLLCSCATDEKVEETIDAKEVILNAMLQEAEERVSNAGKNAVIDTAVSESAQGTVFPENFDLRSVDTDGDGVLENYVTSMKQQRPFGSCWAFSAITAAETSALYNSKTDAVSVDEEGNKHDSLDLSEHHTAWFADTLISEGSQKGEGLVSKVKGVEENASLTLNSGSTQFVAAQLFASGIGPVKEDEDTAYCGKEKLTAVHSTTGALMYSSEDDWSLEESERFNSDYFMNDFYFLPSSVSFDESGNYDMEYAESVIATYKEALMSGHAIAIAYHADSYHPNKESAAPQYINTDTWAHYCYEPVRANHGVTIVGWDDDYDPSNFLSEAQVREDGELVFDEEGNAVMKDVTQPSKKGAWIVKNSWGAVDSIADGLVSNDWGIDGSGYFYLSYYDQTLETAQCFDLSEKEADYHIEQYNYLTSETLHSVQSDITLSTANVFVAEEAETIKALSCITTSHNEKVSVSIYRINNDDLTDKTLLSQMEEEFSYAGLHTIEIGDEITINKGEKFAVVISQENEEGCLFSICSDYNLKGYEAGYCDDAYAAQAVVNQGESYFCYGDEWIDLSEIKEELENKEGASSYLAYDNFPVKVYTVVE